jgi:hypothetical protein
LRPERLSLVIYWAYRLETREPIRTRNFAGLDGGACSPLPRRPRRQDFLGVRTYSTVQSGRIVEITLLAGIGPK